MKRWVKRGAVLIGLFVLILVLQFTVFAPERVPVDVVTVASGSVEETVTNSQAGTIRARKRARLSPEFGGTVIAIPFREGDRVARGDVVLRLDAVLPEAELRLAERDLDTAAAQQRQTCFAAELAAREKDRIRRLAEDEIASQSLMDEANTEADRTDAACQAAAASVERARASVMVARTRTEKTVLRAPFDGVVAELTTEVGEWVSPSPPALPIPPVIDILDPDTIYVKTWSFR